MWVCVYYLLLYTKKMIKEKKSLVWSGIGRFRFNFIAEVFVIKKCHLKYLARTV